MTTASLLLKEELLQKAYSLGFDLVKVTSPEPLTDVQRELETRLKLGLSVPLAAGTPAERTTPALHLPGVKSIVVVAMAYSVDPSLIEPDGKEKANSTEDPSADPFPKGRLSRYAWGEDYHRVMLPRLKELAEFLQEAAPGTSSLPMVDSGPLLEKALAYRAGLGFYGWNSCIITDRFGSWVFLGILLTTASLPPDPFEPRTCRKCGRCIEACPTGAIIRPYVVDPKLCLSYATQARGMIPEKLRVPMDDRLFGCDTCQEVCPHNAAAQWRNHQEFFPHPQIGTAPSLAMVMGLTSRCFRGTFARTAAGWRGKKVLQRNAAINLGNSGSLQAIPLLAKALADSSEPVRMSAEWALARVEKLNKTPRSF
ncbi:MAG TPA: tRNA epoxyqueuosine(34) reductase QueG [Firmicutes bacterium]|nr:tRNA epoxyqueuosine(34) reductase QueG [Bacillota bacterium]